MATLSGSAVRVLDVDVLRVRLSPASLLAHATTDSAYRLYMIGEHVDGRAYTIAELEAIFDLISDHSHWKNGFQAWVDPHFAALCSAAACFFQGRYLSFMRHRSDGKVLVYSTGYACH